MSLAAQLGAETAVGAKQANALLGRALGGMGRMAGNAIQRGMGGASRLAGRAFRAAPLRTLAAGGLGAAAANEGLAAANQATGGWVPHFNLGPKGTSWWDPNAHVAQQQQTTGLWNNLTSAAAKPVQSLLGALGKAGPQNYTPENMWNFSGVSHAFDGLDENGQPKFRMVGKPQLQPAVQQMLDRYNQQRSMLQRLGLIQQEASASSNAANRSNGRGGSSHITFSPVLQDPLGRIYKDTGSIY